VDYASGPPVTFELLDVLRRVVPDCRFVFLSSAAVYGNPPRLPISEEESPSPISPYGFHKWQSEVLCREFSQVYHLSTASVRVFSAYGDGLERQVLWDICRQLLKGEQLALHGTGRETRDFVHVRDVAAAVLAIAKLPEMHRDVFNLASGSRTSIRDLASLAIRSLNIDAVPVFDGYIRPGDPLHWQADIRKISALGYSPSIMLEQGVGQYAQWCRTKLSP
jgi:UDP-glucose 4-epimerase